MTPTSAPTSEYARRMTLCRACPKAKSYGPLVTCGVCGCIANGFALIPQCSCRDKQAPQWGPNIPSRPVTP